MADEPGVRLALAHVGLVLAAVLAAGLALPAGASLALLGLTLLLSCRRLPPTWAAATGASAWAIWTGFSEHRFGQLTLTAPDLRHLALLVAVGALASVLDRAVRRG